MTFVFLLTVLCCAFSAATILAATVRRKPNPFSQPDWNSTFKPALKGGQQMKRS